jgi:5-enolpyruvylshikimate-3-phosphate synthase
LLAEVQGLLPLPGVVVEEREDAWLVHGSGGSLPGGGTIDLGASGTSARFLVALAALGERPSMLDGSARLRERPIDELIEALSSLGAAIEPRDGPASRSARGDRESAEAGSRYRAHAAANSRARCFWLPRPSSSVSASSSALRASRFHTST